MNAFDVYKDIQARTNGDIYIGVVGPVRTGKSTFIKRFMDLFVLPNIKDENDKLRTIDEMPQSGSGKTIMTTEPKFIPKEAVEVRLDDELCAKIRLIDCVGYMVKGVNGFEEEAQERQVKTPWYDHEIPFSKAASIGTKKVIHDHSTIGIVVTTDGSIGELDRECFLDAEDKTIQELKNIGKPFVVLVNSKRPYSEDAKMLAEQMEEKYMVPALAVNCEQLRKEDISNIMQKILYEFPITEIQFFIPKWVEMLQMEHPIKTDLIENVKKIMYELNEIKDIKNGLPDIESVFIDEKRIEHVAMDTGVIQVKLHVGEEYYYQTLSDLTGTQINGQYDLICTMKELSNLKKEYVGVKDAINAVRMKGYGVVSPIRDEIVLDEPIIIKQGNKYGVKIHTEAPTIHMIKANIETDIAPIVGNEKQAEDLIQYIKQETKTEDGIWSTNIFGKSVEDLVMEGMKNKMMMVNDESQVKLQDTMQKIVNDSNGGMVCIII